MPSATSHASLFIARLPRACGACGRIWTRGAGEAVAPAARRDGKSGFDGGTTAATPGTMSRSALAPGHCAHNATATELVPMDS